MFFFQSTSNNVPFKPVIALVAQSDSPSCHSTSRPPSQHPRLLTEIAEHEAIRLKPWQPIDQATPVSPTDYWHKVSSLVDAQLNKTTPLFWALNGEPGLWVGFKADQTQYWLALEREHINDTFDTE